MTTTLDLIIAVLLVFGPSIVWLGIAELRRVVRAAADGPRVSGRRRRGADLERPGVPPNPPPESGRPSRTAETGEHR